MNKRLIPFVLFFFLLLGRAAGVRAQAFPVTAYVSGDWIVTDDETGIALLDYLGNETDLVIPTEIEGQPVVRLGKELFMGNLRLRSVVIPWTVTVMEANAFNGCVSLEQVTLGGSIKRIDTGTFRNCISLKEILFPKSVKSIGNFAFENCRSLTMIQIPWITSLGESAFENCTALNSVTATQRVSSAGPYSFRNTPWLSRQNGEFVYIGKNVVIDYRGSEANVIIPWGVTMFAGLFEDHTEIETVVIPETVKNIGKNAFKNAVNLRSVKFSPYAAAIGESAFEGCVSLESVELPKKLTSIGRAAFAGCKKIRTITLPKELKTLGTLAFSDCDSLTDVYFSETLPKFDRNTFLGSDHAVLWTAYRTGAQRSADDFGLNNHSDLQVIDDYAVSRVDGGYRLERYLGTSEIVYVPWRFGNTPVISIADGAFQNNPDVREVFLSPSIREIGNWAFANMENLNYFEFSAGVKSVGDYVFRGSARLGYVDLPRRISALTLHSFDSYDTVICSDDDTYAAEFMSENGFYKIGTRCYRKAVPVKDDTDQ